MKNRNMYIRCSDNFLRVIRNLKCHTGLSDSDIIAICVYTINDIWVSRTAPKDFLKYLEKEFRHGNTVDKRVSYE